MELPLLALSIACLFGAAMERSSFARFAAMFMLSMFNVMAIVSH